MSIFSSVLAIVFGCEIYNVPLSSKKQWHNFGTKKSRLRNKLQLARAAKEKRAKMVRKPNNESRHPAVPGAGVETGDWVPGPGA